MLSKRDGAFIAAVVEEAVAALGRIMLPWPLTSSSMANRACGFAAVVAEGDEAVVMMEAAEGGG